MKKLLFLVLVYSVTYATNQLQLKPYEKWWELKLSEKFNDFENWLGDIDAPSRQAARAHIKRCNYKTILDVACGLCTEYFGYVKDDIDIAYKGIDITPMLVRRAQELGVPVMQASVEYIPSVDSSFDICYGRHILEHLSYYHKALDEMIRVGRKEVLIVFFLKPWNLPDKICLEPADGALVHHNWYNKDRLISYILSNKKVHEIKWEDVNEQECLLHVYLKN